ncbi:helix-turn-helix domain-containing protein [Acidovorax sp.]|uniref:helix-turn-helix domain-containing protein n=1 Tax=Acidovorax sp. TaxID=1872122 RepID=UPI00391F4A34
MSNSVTNLCRPLRIRPTPKCVLMALADRADDDGVAWPSIAWLSEWTCFSRRAVQNALDDLEGTGLLRISKTAGKNSRCEIVLQKVAAEAENPGTSCTPTRAGGALVEVDEEGANPGTTCTSAADAPVQEVHTHPGTSCTPTRAGGAHGGAGGAPDTSIDTSNTSKKTKEKRAKSGFDALGIELPAWLPAEAWALWVRHRTEARKPITEDGARLQLKTLTKLRAEGHDPVLVIERSVEGGWQGLFPAKDGSTKAAARAPTLAPNDPLRAKAAALPADWWRLAGFDSKWDAEASRCTWMNYTEFRNREHVVPAEGAPA